MTRRKGTLLIVEDDEEIRTTLAGILEDEGYDVVVARDGREGLAVLSTLLGPSLVLLDLMMTGMNGYDFLAALGEVENPPPVLIITAAPETPPGIPFLRKPVRLDELLAAIERTRR